MQCSPNALVRCGSLEVPLSPGPLVFTSLFPNLGCPLLHHSLRLRGMDITQVFHVVVFQVSISMPYDVAERPLSDKCPCHQYCRIPAGVIWRSAPKRDAGMSVFVNANGLDAPITPAPAPITDLIRLVSSNQAPRFSNHAFAAFRGSFSASQSRRWQLGQATGRPLSCSCRAGRGTQFHPHRRHLAACVSLMPSQ